MNLKELLKQCVDDKDLLPELPQENKSKNTEIIKAYKEGYEQGKKDAERHGQWLHLHLDPDNITGHTKGECSICGKLRIVDNYCPNCGAKMEGHFEEPEINPCRGCEDYDGKGGCISNGRCGAKMDEVIE